MSRKAAALLLVCAGIASCISCSTKNINHYVYGALQASSQIIVYREDPNSGVLTVLSGSPFSAGSGVQSLVIHPSKKFLYAANSVENDISLFDLTSGVPKEQSRTPAGTSPQFLVMDPAGNYLYVANEGTSNISAFSIASGSGALSLVGVTGLGPPPNGMVLSPSGNFLYVSVESFPPTIEVFSISAGSLTFVGPLVQTGSNFNYLTISTNGQFLYSANTVDSSISEFAICPNSSVPACSTQANGTLSELSGSPIFTTGSAPLALLVDNTGKFLFSAQRGLNNIGAYSIGSDGGLTVLSNSPFTSKAQPSFIATDPNGKFLFVGNQSGPAIQSFSLNTSNGTLTSVASYTIGSTPTSIAVTQ